MSETGTSDMPIQVHLNIGHEVLPFYFIDDILYYHSAFLCKEHCILLILK